MKDKKTNTAVRRVVRPPEAIDAALRDEHTHGHQAKPISFWPLDFETALEGLLAVPWPPEAKNKKKRRGTSE